MVTLFDPSSGSTNKYIVSSLLVLQENVYFKYVKQKYKRSILFVRDTPMLKLQFVPTAASRLFVLNYFIEAGSPEKYC